MPLVTSVGPPDRNGIGSSDLVLIEQVAAVSLDGMVVILIGQNVNRSVEEINPPDRVTGVDAATERPMP